MKLIYFLLSIILSTCGSPTTEQNITTNPPVTTDIKYEITTMDNRDPIINIDVFLPDTTQLEKLNTFFKGKYNSGRDKFLDVWYFDDIKVAKIYREKVMAINTSKVMDEKSSEEELNTLNRHKIAVYSFNPTTHYENLGR